MGTIPVNPAACSDASYNSPIAPDRHKHYAMVRLRANHNLDRSRNQNI
jgi:hypothetical protein